jgi:hypothetical protein
VNDKYIDPRDFEESFNFGYSSPNKNKSHSQTRKSRYGGSRTIYKTGSGQPLISLTDTETNQSNYQGGHPGGLNSSNLYGTTSKHQSGLKSSLADFAKAA